MARSDKVPFRREFKIAQNGFVGDSEGFFVGDILSLHIDVVNKHVNFFVQGKVGRHNVVIADSLKSNFEFLRLCGKGASPIGATTDAYRASNVEGGSEGYIMTLDFSDQFGMPWGIRIPKDSSLRFVVRIKDNTTGVDAFNMIAYGFDRIIKNDNN